MQPGAQRTKASPTTAAPFRLLVDTGLRLAGDRNLDSVAQTGVSAGLHLSGAHSAIFIYDEVNDDGETTQHFQLAGPSSSPFAQPPAAAIFSPHDLGAPLQRVDDLQQPPSDASHLPFDLSEIRSFLAVPVCTHAGEPLGRMIFTHPDPAVFTATQEPLLHTLAQQLGFAFENVRLATSLAREIALTDHARRQQRETADRLAQALEAGKLGTWTWDRATDMLDLDERAATLFFAQPHRPISRSVLRERIVLPADIPSTVNTLQQSLDDGTDYSAEYRVENPAPAPSDTRPASVWLAASGIPTYAVGSATPTGMVGTVQNITARKTQEATLRESEKLAATGRLAATIAHEINNPLEAVTNLIYLAKTDPEVPQPIQTLLETADSELARVSAIAQQTLGFYRDTSKPVEINLNTVLPAVADLFARKLAYKKVTCSLELDPGLRIFGLQGEIRQVFSNLFVNAIDACGSLPTPGLIRLRGRSCSQRGVPGVSILLCDSGTGIPAEIRERLFAPFFTTKESVGTGLGLWVTRGIVEKQGGRIHFRSRTAGPSGTVFRVFLPSAFPSATHIVPPKTQLLQ